MLFFKKILIYILGIVNLLVFYLTLVKPEKIWYSIATLVVLVFLAVKLLIGRKMPWGEFFAFGGLIVFFNLAGLVFLLVAEDLLLKYFILVANAFISIFYFALIFNYLYSTYKYQPFSLASFCSPLALLTFFFLAVVLFSLQIFLNLSFWLLALILAWLSSFFAWQNFVVNKFEVKKYAYYLFIIAILGFELAGLLSWWPISYYLKGLFLTLFYYLSIILINFNIRGSFNKKSIVWQSMIVLVIFVASLLTARWF